MFYSLSSSQAERMSFDDMTARVTTEMIETLTDDEALAQDPEEYANLVWKALENDDVNGIVDDVKEAKFRVISTAHQAVLDYQAELMNTTEYIMRDDVRPQEITEVMSKHDVPQEQLKTALETKAIYDNDPGPSVGGGEGVILWDTLYKEVYVSRTGLWEVPGRFLRVV